MSTPSSLNERSSEGVSPASTGSIYQKRKWATTEDWDRHRDTIKALYIVQRRRLRDVMQIMQDEYQLFATEKMYKLRLRQWGFNKYPRHTTAASFISGRATRIASETEYLSRVKPSSETAKYERDNQQRPIVSNAAMPQQHQARRVRSRQKAMEKPLLSAVLAVPRRVEAPADMKLPEECLYLVRNYVAVSFDSDQWRCLANGNLHAPSSSRSWLDKLGYAACILESRKWNRGMRRPPAAPPTSAASFRLVDSCFEHWGRMLRGCDGEEDVGKTGECGRQPLGDRYCQTQDPLLLTNTYLAMAHLHRISPDLSRMFLRYARDLCAIVLPESHPLRLLLHWLRGQDDNGAEWLSRHAEPLMDCYLAMLGTHLGDTSEFFISQSRELSLVLACSGWSTTESSVARTQRLLERLESLAYVGSSPSLEGPHKRHAKLTPGMDHGEQEHGLSSAAPLYDTCWARRGRISPDAYQASIQSIKSALSFLYFDMRDRDEEAERLARDVLWSSFPSSSHSSSSPTGSVFSAHADDDDIPRPPEAVTAASPCLAECLSLLMARYHRQDNPDEAVRRARANRAYGFRVWGRGHHESARFTLELMQVLYKFGWEREGELVRQEFEGEWVMACERAEKGLW